MSFDPCGLDVPQEDIEALFSLVRMFRAERKGKLIGVEVGTWTGRTTLIMVEGGLDEVHCIDSWKGTENPEDQTHSLVRGYEPDHVFKTFEKNMGDLLVKRVYPHVGYSADLVKTWGVPIDFLFIDADHSYAACKHDILEWGSHVVSGGIISGHDYGSWDGVNKAVDETGGCTKIGCSIWWRRK